MGCPKTGLVVSASNQQTRACFLATQYIELGLLELDRTINIISYIQLIFRAASLVYMHVEERKDASGI